MSSRLLMLFIIFLVAKYGSVVGGLFSAIVSEGLKGKGTIVRGDSTTCLGGILYISDSVCILNLHPSMMCSGKSLVCVE